MMNSFYVRLRVWASVLAFSAVGALFVPCSHADSVTTPDAGTSNLVIRTVIDSILSSTVEDAWIVQDYGLYCQQRDGILDALQSIASSEHAVLFEADLALREALEYLNEIDPKPEYYTEITNEIYTALQEISYSIGGVQFAITQVQNIDNQIYEDQILRAATMTVEPGETIDPLTTAEMRTLLAEYNLTADDIETLLAEYQCQCPDYTDLLERIVDASEAIRAQIDTVDFRTVFARLRPYFTSFSGTSMYQWGISDYTNSIFASAWLYPSLYGFGDVFEQSMNAYAQGGWTNGFTRSVNDGNEYAAMLISDIVQSLSGMLSIDAGENAPAIVQAWRDFYLNPQTYIYPTNTVSNPLWVSFTNTVLSVSIADSDLTLSTETEITNFRDFFSLLSNVVVNVSITNNQEDVMNAELEFAEGKLGEHSDPENELPEYEETDLSFIDTLVNGVGSVVGSYSSAFSSIPTDMPSDIMVWSGGVFGPLSIESIHWNPAETSGRARALTIIRSIFQCVWGFILVAVIISLAMFNFRICIFTVAFVWTIFTGKGGDLPKHFVNLWHGVLNALADAFFIN